MVAHLAWIVLVGLSQAPGPQAAPEALVRQLGSARYAEREQAAAELEKLGRDALAALRAGRQSRDPEVRTRASALFDKIEGALLTRPTAVKLDFRDRPLGEVVGELNRRADLGLVLMPENNDVWATRRVTLVEPEPVPFWTVVDRLCQAGLLQYNFGFSSTPGRATTLPLFEGDNRLPGPVADSGPFRVNLTGLHYQRDVQFLAGGIGRQVPPPGVQALPAGERRVGEPAIHEMFSVNLQVAAEPRLMLQQNGQPRVTEAVDDKGQSLAPPSDASGMQRFSGYMGFNTMPMIQLQMPLARPESPGTRIQKLQGVIPVVVSARKPDPTAIPLAEGPNRTFSNEDAQITFLEMKPHPQNAQTLIDLTIRPAADGPTPPVAEDVPAGVAPSRQDLANQQRIEILDAKGNPLPWFPSNIRIDQDSTRMTLLLPNQDPAQGEPATLRYHAMIWATAEVPFEFRDLPMP